MRKHEHTLVPHRIYDLPVTPGQALTGAPPIARSVVLFRCEKGCTDPAAYVELKMVGRWVLDDLTAPAGEKALVDEAVAAAMNAAEVSA
jgi:hypothetical protein